MTMGVFCKHRSGALHPTPPRIPSRGTLLTYGNGTIFNTQIAALCVSRGSGNRMGLGSPAGKHPGHQLQRNVHSDPRYALGGSGLHRTLKTRQAGKNGLLRETGRAGTRDGSLAYGFRIPTTGGFSEFSVFSCRNQPMISLRAARHLYLGNDTLP